MTEPRLVDRYLTIRAYLTVGNRFGYRGNRPYRRGSVGVTDPTKPTFSVNRPKTSVNRTGFVGFKNRYCSGFWNPAHYSSLHLASVAE
jgi:hypothetical protein